MAVGVAYSRINTGSLDRRISIERKVEGAANGFNEASVAWSKLTDAWAQRRDVSDVERYTANHLTSAIMARFTIRHNAISVTITTMDRIQHEGIWEIKGVKETRQGRNQYIEITAVQSSD